MRLFSAVEIPEEAKEKIYNLHKGIQTSAIVKWVREENLHITLKFFGEVDLPPQVVEVVKEASKDLSPFEVSLQGLGAFPGQRRIVVLWVGIDLGKEKLIDLYRGIENQGCRFGFKKEGREYTPHITIGRVKRGKLSFPEVGISYSPFLAKEVTLFKSTLTPKGPIYEVVEHFPLGEN